MFQQSSLDQTPVIKNLLIINVLVLLAQNAPGPLPNILTQWFALWPIAGARGIDFYPWQLVTYGFMHADFFHLLFNMFGLWMLGTPLEQVWGSRRFTVYYLICVVGGALLQVLFNVGGFAYTVGASAGVLGIVMAFGMIFPNQELFLMFIPVPIKAKWFAAGYALISVFSLFGPASNIAHLAHLGGMLFGFLLIQYWRGKLPIQPKDRMYY